MSAFGDFLNQLRGFGSVLAGRDPSKELHSDPNVPYGASLPQLNTYLTSQQPQAPQAQPASDVTPAGGGGGGATYTNPLAPYLSQVQGDQNGINDLYSKLFGGVDSQVADQTNQLTNQYNTQFANADKAFANTQNTTNNMMYARGAGDSSYNAAAQGANQDIYNQDHSNMVNAENQGLAGLGKYADTTKAGLTAAKNADQYDLSQYTDVPSLTALHQQLGQHIGNLQQQLAGLGTNQQYLDTVNKIAPIQSQAASQLSQKLANLVNTSASPEAKDALAQGYISQAQLTDPNAKNYWLGYFNDLNKKAQTATPAAV